MQTWKRKKTANLRSILIFWTYLSRRVVSLVVRVLSLKRAKNVSLHSCRFRHWSTPRLVLFQITTTIISRTKYSGWSALSTGFTLWCYQRLSFHLAVSWLIGALSPVNHTGLYHLAEATRKRQSTSRISSFFSAHGSDFGWNWRTTVQNNGEQNKKLGTLHFKGRERHNVKSTTHTQSMRRGVSPNRPGRQTDGARWISQGIFQNTKCLKPLCAIVTIKWITSFLWFKPKLGAVFAGAEPSTVKKKNDRVYAIKACCAFKISCQTWILDEIIIYVVWYLLTGLSGSSVKNLYGNWARATTTRDFRKTRAATTQNKLCFDWLSSCHVSVFLCVTCGVSCLVSRSRSC